MEIEIKNFGPIDSLKFNLNKDLHLIYGQNAIGKSYATYCLYCLIKNIKNKSIGNRHMYFYDKRDENAYEKFIKSKIKSLKTNKSIDCTKEFNTLIMLNNLNDEQFSIFNKKYKDYNREDKLDTSKIALYITREELIKLAEFSSRVKRKILKKAEINSIFGIEAISFDETINEMNAIQDTIYYEIEDDKQSKKDFQR